MTFDEDKDDDEVLNNTFKAIDNDGDGILHRKEIESALLDYMLKSELQLTDAFHSLLDSLPEGSAAGIDLKEFKDCLSSVHRIRGRRVQWARSLNLDYLLASQLKVGILFDELSGIKNSNEKEIDQALGNFFKLVSDVVKEQWAELKKPDSLRSEEVETAFSKFNGQLGKFGDSQMFHEGLENQIGVPDPFILKGILRENVQADGSKERSVTSNYKLVFSDFQEYARLLGDTSEYKTGTQVFKTSGIPTYLLEVAEGLHPGVKGPSLKELLELQPEFSKLLLYHITMREMNSDHFPGDIGHVQAYSRTEFEACNVSIARSFHSQVVAKAKAAQEIEEPHIDAGEPPSGNRIVINVYAPNRFFYEGHLDELLQSLQKGSHELESVKESGTSHHFCIYCDLNHMDSERRQHLRQLLEGRKPSDLQFMSGLLDETSLDTCIDSILTAVLQPEAPGQSSARFNLRQGRRHLGLRELMALPDVKAAGLRVEEAIQAYQYTGPIFQHWNGLLRCMPFGNHDDRKESSTAGLQHNGTSKYRRDGSADSKMVFAVAADGLAAAGVPQDNSAQSPNNLYPSSIHALVSAVLKLSRKTKIPPGRKTFRGLGRMKLGQEWFNKDARGASCGVELGFMSTTLSRKVALEYSGVKMGGIGTIFEFDVGAVDSGAQLDSLSQYPGEGEFLFPPLSHLEVVGNVRVEKYEHKPVLIVSVKVNINQKARIIEEILSQRQQTILAIGDGLSREIRFDLQFVSAEPCNLAKLSEHLQNERKRDATWFNKDANFVAALEKLLDLKLEVVEDFVKKTFPRLSDTGKVFRDAASRGKSEIICSLLKLRVDVNCKGNFDFTPLHFAAMDGSKEIVKTLIDHRGNTRALDSNDCIPLHFAAEYGHTEAVIELIKAAGTGIFRAFSQSSHFSDYINAKGKDGDTPLHMAARNGHTETVKVLVDSRADVLAADCNGRTALHFAAHNGKTATVQALISLGADINTESKRKDMISSSGPGFYTLCLCGCCILCCCPSKLGSIRFEFPNGQDTPLHLAAAGGHVETVQALVDSGASINAENQTKQTPVMLAVKSCSVKLLQAMTSSGDFHPDTPFHDDSDGIVAIFQRTTFLHHGAAAGNSDFVRALLDLRASVNATNDPSKETPLHVAAQKGHLEVVQALLSRSAAINARDRIGQTPLFVAARSDRSEVARALLEKGAAADARVDDGLTPLHIAALRGHAQVVRVLVEMGASVEAEVGDGTRPVDLALKNGHGDVVSILQERLPAASNCH